MVTVLVWFGLVIRRPTKQTKDGSPGQKKPLVAFAIQQHQKPNENVQFLPELRSSFHAVPSMKSQIALVKYFTHAHALHLLNGANQKKCENTH